MMILLPLWSFYWKGLTLPFPLFPRDTFAEPLFKLELILFCDFIMIFDCGLPIGCCGVRFKMFLSPATLLRLGVPSMGEGFCILKLEVCA